MPAPQFGKGPVRRVSAMGSFYNGPRPYGFAAAPTRPGRRTGGGTFPVLHGLFASGARPVRQMSSIVTMQNVIYRGQA